MSFGNVMVRVSAYAKKRKDEVCCKNVHSHKPRSLTLEICGIRDNDTDQLQNPLRQGECKVVKGDHDL